MKKALTFISAILLVAVMAQASSVKWSAKDIADEKGNKITDAKVYVFVVADSKETPSTTIVNRDTIVSAIQSGNTSVLSQATGTGKVTSLKQANITFDGGWAENDTVTAFMVIYDSANPDSSAKAIITSNLTTTLGAQGATTGTFGSQSGATWTPVPEPTTVALFALGLAALGLKRKVA